MSCIKHKIVIDKHLDVMYNSHIFDEEIFGRKMPSQWIYQASPMTISCKKCGKLWRSIEELEKELGMKIMEYYKKELKKS